MDFLWTLLGEVLTSPVQPKMTLVVAEEMRMPAANPRRADPLFVSTAGIVFKHALQPDRGALNVGLFCSNKSPLKRLSAKTGRSISTTNCPEGQTAIGVPRTTGFGSTVETHVIAPYLASPAAARGWFISQTTPPAPGLRVVVRNASLVQTIEQMPYTDREYDKGVRSESFVTAIADEHDSKFFAVKSGTNHLLYQIKRDNQVIESGEFAVTIDVQVQNITKTTRIGRSKEHLHCMGPRDEKTEKVEKDEKKDRRDGRRKKR